MLLYISESLSHHALIKTRTGAIKHLKRKNVGDQLTLSPIDFSLSLNCIKSKLRYIGLPIVETL